MGCHLETLTSVPGHGKHGKPPKEFPTKQKEESKCLESMKMKILAAALLNNSVTTQSI
jgi:hypothetical protein